MKTGLLSRASIDGDVGRVHLLGRVPAEAVHAEGDQAVQVAGLLLLHVAGPGVQVGQAAQLAVPHLRLVVPVGDRGVAAMEVGLAVQRRVVEHVRERRAVVPHPAVDLAGHVVQHHVGVDLDAGRVAGRDHRRELGLGAEPRVQAVADRLVGLPPRVAVGGQYHGFLGRRDLHRAIPVRAEHVAALRADGRPRPVEHLHDDPGGPGAGRRWYRRRPGHGGPDGGGPDRGGVPGRGGGGR